MMQKANRVVRAGAAAAAAVVAAVALAAVPACVCALFGTTQAFADEAPDITKTDCSITLSYTDADGTPLTGGEFALYHVAEVHADTDSNLFFDASGTDFAACGATFDDIQDARTAEALAAFAAENGASHALSSLDANGTLTFAPLPVGLYLVAQTEPIPGYYLMAPFLVSVPWSNADGSWNYHVNAAPKGETNPTPAPPTSLTVRKVWVDDGARRPPDITLQLLRGDVVAGTVTLSDANGWTHTWTGLDGAYEWSVREINIPRGYEASYRRSGTEITVTNTTTLVFTGQANRFVPVLAAAGLAVFLAGWLLAFGKRRREA